MSIEWNGMYRSNVRITTQNQNKYQNKNRNQNQNQNRNQNQNQYMWNHLRFVHDQREWKKHL